MGASQDERERLRSVYARYRVDDEVADRWAGTNPGNAAILAERVAVTGELVRAWGGLGRGGVVLDVGCGASTTLGPEVQREDVTRVGVDILFERLLDAATTGAFVGLVCADGAALPLRSASVDLVTVFTVFSSVGSPSLSTAIAGDIARVLRPGGAVLWYDFRYRNPGNPHTHPVRRHDAEQLFPGFSHRWRGVTLVPPLARRLGVATRLLYPRLAAVPFARSHLLGLFVKPG